MKQIYKYIKILYLIFLSVNSAVFALAPKNITKSPVSITEYYTKILLSKDSKNYDYFSEIDLLSREEIWGISNNFLAESGFSVDDSDNEKVLNIHYDDRQLTFYLCEKESNEVKGALIFTYIESRGTIEFDFIELENDPDIRGRRIMPVLYRWLGSHPKYSLILRGCKIYTETTVPSAKAWMRGSLFSPKAVYKNQGAYADYDIFGIFPDWYSKEFIVRNEAELAFAA